jgi:hypothetical protein
MHTSVLCQNLSIPEYMASAIDGWNEYGVELRWKPTGLALVPATVFVSDLEHVKKPGDFSSEPSFIVVIGVVVGVVTAEVVASEYMASAIDGWNEYGVELRWKPTGLALVPATVFKITRSATPKPVPDLEHVKKPGDFSSEPSFIVVIGYFGDWILDSS